MTKSARFIFSCVFVLSLAIVTSACLPSSTENTPSSENQELTEKSGFTTLSGTISQQGSSFLLQTATGPITLQSFEIDLAQYVGQSVSVTGKYSGDELFVSEIAQ